MKINQIIVLVTILSIGCHKKPDIEIKYNYSMVNDSIGRLEISLYNTTNKNFLVLNTCHLNKVGTIHPCEESNLDFYSRISSHTIGDCFVNRGQKLFRFNKMVPFDKREHKKIKIELSKSEWFHYMDHIFQYLDDSELGGSISPKILLVNANDFTRIQYDININNLDHNDKGNYSCQWFSRKEIIELSNPVNKAKPSLKNAMKEVNVYKLYEGEKKSNEYIFKL